MRTETHKPQSCDWGFLHLGKHPRLPNLRRCVRGLIIQPSHGGAYILWGSYIRREYLTITYIGLQSNHIYLIW